MFVLSVLEAPNTKTNSLCVQTHLAIKLFLILILVPVLIIVQVRLLSSLCCVCLSSSIQHSNCVSRSVTTVKLSSRVHNINIFSLFTLNFSMRTQRAVQPACCDSVSLQVHHSAHGMHISALCHSVLEPFIL